MKQLVKPNLSMIGPFLGEQALRALEEGHVSRFLGMAAGGNQNALVLLIDNIKPLKCRGLYEKGLLDAFISTRDNNLRYSFDTICYLFSLADKEKLKAAGDELPGPGPFTLYRGVAGDEPARRIKGLSWTSSLDTAIWYAGRFPDLVDPALYSVTVEEGQVLAFTNDREEEEFLLLLPQSVNPVRQKGIDIIGEHARVCAERRRKYLEDLENVCQQSRRSIS